MCQHVSQLVVPCGREENAFSLFSHHVAEVRVMISRTCTPRATYVAYEETPARRISVLVFVLTNVHLLTIMQAAFNRLFINTDLCSRVLLRVHSSVFVCFAMRYYVCKFCSLRRTVCLAVNLGS